MAFALLFVSLDTAKQQVRRRVCLDGKPLRLRVSERLAYRHLTDSWDRRINSSLNSDQIPSLATTWKGRATAFIGFPVLSH
jgi:hypothetical protein